MLDWGALIGEREAVENAENSPPSGGTPHYFSSDSEIVGRLQPSNGEAYKEISPLSPPSPLKKWGGRLETENETRARGGATDNLSDKKTHPLSPVAVCLLLDYWKNVGGDMNELAGALVGLQSFAPDEQTRCWAQSCSDVGLDPWRVVHLPSFGEGVECTGCKHLCCRTDLLPHTRRRYFWLCDLHHQILEHYQRGERVLIAPQECKSWEHWEPVPMFRRG